MLIGFHWCRGSTRLLSAFKKSLWCQRGMSPPMEVLPVWPALTACGYRGAVPARSGCGFVNLSVCYLGRRLVAVPSLSVLANPSYCVLPLALLPLVSEWKPPQRLRGLTALRAGRLGFGLPGKITKVERIPAVVGESLLSSCKRTMVWGKDME